MKGKLILLLTLLTTILFACKEQETFDSGKLASFEVKQRIAENQEGDYLFRLESLKPSYQVGEPVEVIGEIVYLGDKNEVTIHHSAVVIHFAFEEKVRDYLINIGVAEIGKSTILKQGEAYQEKFKKQFVFKPEEPADYVKFIDSFLKEEGFPIGYYEVKASADFYVEETEESIKIEAGIDFKVEAE